MQRTFPVCCLMSEVFYRKLLLKMVQKIIVVVQTDCGMAKPKPH